MAKDASSSACWALTPDETGSYIDGTWSSLAAMAGNRIYFASAVLADGRLLVSGGEIWNGLKVWTTRSEIYDPVGISWSQVAPPANWAQVGDASCALLPDNRLLLGSIQTTAFALFDPTANPGGSPFTISGNTKGTNCDEESWVLLPDGTVLTVQCASPPGVERYIPSTDSWIADRSTPVSLVIPVSTEISPALVLPDWRGALFVGGTGVLAIYKPDPDTTNQGTWVQGPTLPNDSNGLTMQAKDNPACLLPNGHVLFAAGNNDQGVTVTYPNGLFLFAYDPVANTFAGVPTGPVSNTLQPYVVVMLALPTGQVLVSVNQTIVYVYTPAGAPQPSWRPVIDE